MFMFRGIKIDTGQKNQDVHFQVRTTFEQNCILHTAAGTEVKISLIRKSSLQIKLILVNSLTRNLDNYFPSEQNKDIDSVDYNLNCDL
jgi:hypothetical protein